MNTKQILDDNSVKVIPERYGVEYAGVFGSFARGEETQESDIDFLISLKKPIGLLSLAKLQQGLSEVLGRKVDLVTEKALSPYIRNDVMHDMKLVYGTR